MEQGPSHSSTRMYDDEASEWLLKNFQIIREPRPQSSHEIAVQHELARLALLVCLIFIVLGFPHNIPEL
jgi:hypothetical protein